MRQSNLAAAALLALALAACQQADDNNIAIDSANDVENGTEALPPSDMSGAPIEADNGADLPNTVADNAAEPATGAAIPAQYRGRWGMVPLDCTGDPSAAKGLIAIDGSSIKFYESRATLKEQRPAIATSFSGLFGFTGEGMTWEKTVTLTRTGDKLKRADDEGSYDYTRCA